MEAVRKLPPGGSFHGDSERSDLVISRRNLEIEASYPAFTKNNVRRDRAQTDNNEWERDVDW